MAEDACALLADPVASAISCTDRTLWLSVYHKRIGSYRESIRREVLPSATLTDGLAAVLDEADRVFSELLRALLQRLGEEDDATMHLLGAEAVARRFLSLQTTTKKVVPDTATDASVAAMRACCARCLVYLGDVARYRQMHLRPAEGRNGGAAERSAHSVQLLGGSHRGWRLAARCYERALLVSTAQSGSAHNQLAVLAQTQSDRSMAIMHYLCALAATKPFDVARGNLTVLVDKSGVHGADVTGFGTRGKETAAAAAADGLCARLAQLFLDRLAEPRAESFPALRNRLDDGVAHLGRLARGASNGGTTPFPLRLVQPLMLSAICAAHARSESAGPPEDSTQLAIDTLIGLVVALHPLLPPVTSPSQAPIAEGGGRSGGFALLDVLDADSQAVTSGMGGGPDYAAGDAVMESASSGLDWWCVPYVEVLRGILPAMAFLATTPSLLSHASPERLSEYGRAITALARCCGGPDWLGDPPSQSAEMDEDLAPLLTPLHVSLLGLEPMAPALADLVTAVQHQLATRGGVVAAGEPTADSLSVLSVAQALRAGTLRFLRQMARSADSPRLVHEALRGAGAGANAAPPSSMPPPPPHLPAGGTSTATKRGRVWEWPFGKPDLLARRMGYGPAGASGIHPGGGGAATEGSPIGSFAWLRAK